jgi:hypothetical protein
MRQALELALDALTYIHTETSADEDELISKAITALRLAIDAQNMASESTYKEALAQTQDPVVERAWFTIAELNAWADKKLAENPNWVMPTEEPERKEALAQPVQEPIICKANQQCLSGLPCVCVAPAPQRTWVGLTMQDVKVIEDNAPSIQMAIFMTEATLKDKNHGNS